MIFFALKKAIKISFKHQILQIIKQPFCMNIFNPKKALGKHLPRDIVKVKLNESEQLQRIGVCSVEQVIGNGNHSEQPEDVLVSLYYNQEQNYARVIKKEVALQKPSTLQKERENEKLVERSLTFSHALVCPHYQLMRLGENFDLSDASQVGLAACGIIVDSNDHVLMTKRNPEMRTYPRCWVFPGGQVDTGETFQETLFREIQEEVGLTIVTKQQQDEIIVVGEEEAENEPEDLIEIPDDEEEEEGKGTDGDNKQNGEFKRKTRLQSKKQEQKATNIKGNKQDNQPTKGKVHLIEGAKAFYLYESVYPTQLQISYPQRSSLVLFYLLKIKESYQDIQLSQQKSEIDYSAWIPLKTLYKILQEKEVNQSAFAQSEIDTAVSINHNYFPISINTFIGIYPNSIGEGIGEAHIKALNFLTTLKYNNKKQQPPSSLL